MNQGIFHDAPNFTSHLSAVVKITQLCVIRLSLNRVARKKNRYPGIYIQRFKERWLMTNQRTPFAHILTLRAYGRRIRNCTTAQGFMAWSDGMQTLTCREVRLELPCFRGFLRRQLDLLDRELEQLLLGPLSPSPDASGGETPTYLARLARLDLADLHDNPGDVSAGHSFLKDPRNGLQDLDQQLLRRVF